MTLLASLGVTNAEYSNAGFGVRYETDPPPGMVVPEGGAVLHQVGFATPWERFGMLPDDERRAATLEYLRAFVNRAPSFSPARAHIMPLLQPVAASWRASMRLALQFKGMNVVDPGLATRPFAAGLQIAFVLDSPNKVQFVTSPVAAEVAGSPEGLFELAVENLRRSTTAPLEALRPGVYRSPLEDEYDAARVLLAERFLTLPLKGHPVVFIPNRVTLLVTGSEDVDNLLLCVEAIRTAIRTDARPVTRTPLGLTSDGWQPWLPPRTSPARAALCSLFHEAVQSDLAESAELLASRYPDVSVAALGTLDSETTPRVLALVTDGSTLHLPRADVVSRDGGATTEPWEAFASRHAAQLVPVEETGGQWFRFAPG
ncbi:MAG: hypothetical protein MUC96_05620 [Myxococcaceae bacterium]|nr:hypothetical protein [Myxococcaceae bacterium]